MDLTNQWLLYITLLSVVVAFFHHTFYSFFKKSMTLAQQRLLSFFFLLMRYIWPFCFFSYLVGFTKNEDLSGAYVSFQLAILFCAGMIDLLHYGYQRALKRKHTLAHLQHRLKTVEARLNALQQSNT